MERRLIDLEIHCMHLERTVQELNEVLYTQQQAIDRLEEELRALKERVVAGAPSPVREAEDEGPPPHY